MCVRACAAALARACPAHVCVTGGRTPIIMTIMMERMREMNSFIKRTYDDITRAPLPAKQKEPRVVARAIQTRLQKRGRKQRIRAYKRTDV